MAHSLPKIKNCTIIIIPQVCKGYVNSFARTGVYHLRNIERGRAIAFAAEFTPKWEKLRKRREKLHESSRFVGCGWQKSDLKGPDVGKIIQM
jgi:hypothetical protein